MDHAVSWGMDRGMDHGVWIVCGPGTLIHALYLYPLPYIYIYITQFICLYMCVCPYFLDKWVLNP